MAYPTVQWPSEQCPSSTDVLFTHWWNRHAAGDWGNVVQGLGLWNLSAPSPEPSVHSEETIPGCLASE